MADCMLCGTADATFQVLPDDPSTVICPECHLHVDVLSLELNRPLIRDHAEDRAD